VLLDAHARNHHAFDSGLPRRLRIAHDGAPRLASPEQPVGRVDVDGWRRDVRARTPEEHPRPPPRRLPLAASTPRSSSRLRSVSRLSYSGLPRATAISTFTRPFFK